MVVITHRMIRTSGSGSLLRINRKEKSNLRKMELRAIFDSSSHPLVLS